MHVLNFTVRIQRNIFYLEYFALKKPQAYCILHEPEPATLLQYYTF